MVGPARVFAFVASLVGVYASGCASTEYINEGSGQPTERASGRVPSGSLGVCKVPNTKRPPIVNVTLWEHAKPCVPSTPMSFVRIGYGRVDPNDAEADKQVERILEGLRKAQDVQKGNTEALAMLRVLRDEALKVPRLRDRVSKDPRPAACDYTYLLNTMMRERPKLGGDERCTAEAYDQTDRKEACLFDPARAEATWLTSGWSCLMSTVALGREESCHALCAYDDYCSRQVSCAAQDVDLVLCALGVCLPEQRAGFYGPPP